LVLLTDVLLVDDFFVVTVGVFVFVDGFFVVDCLVVEFFVVDFLVVRFLVEVFIVVEVFVVLLDFNKPLTVRLALLVGGVVPGGTTMVEVAFAAGSSRFCTGSL